MIGCAGAPRQSGFLSTYDNLQQVTATFRRYLPPGIKMRNTEWGQVEEVMNGWAKRLAKRIDEAHAPTKRGERHHVPPTIARR